MRRRSVLQPLSGEPPSEFKIFGMGPNPATDGIPAIVDPSDVERIMAAFAKLGRPLAGKVEHNRGETACRFGLEARIDGIYGVDAQWTPDGATRWSGWQSSFISPEFDADKRGHVCAIWGVGLTDDPASFNPVSVHQRSIQGMPLLSDALMAVAPEGAQSCEVTTDGRVIYYVEAEDYDDRVIVMGYSIDGDGLAILEGRPVETEVAVVVVEPAEDAPAVPVVTTFEVLERPESIEIERAVKPVQERTMAIDEAAILAKHPGGVITGVCITMPDGQMMAADLQGNPMPMPGMAQAPTPTPAAPVSAVAPPMDPAVMRGLIEAEVQRSIAAMRPMVAESIAPIVQPAKIDKPVPAPVAGAKPGPVFFTFRKE